MMKKLISIGILLLILAINVSAIDINIKTEDGHLRMKADVVNNQLTNIRVNKPTGDITYTFYNEAVYPSMGIDQRQFGFIGTKGVLFVHLDYNGEHSFQYQRIK